MFFSQLHEYLPELAMNETRTITLPKSLNGIPAAEYGLIEMYCNEKKCDCRRVFLNVVSSQTQDSVAVIAFGWENEKFYARWMGFGKHLNRQELLDVRELKGPCLNRMSPQSKYAPEILKLVTECVLNDDVYVNRLKRHYKLFKEIVNGR
ncbi:MAG: hypothetical protein LBB91_05125 [Clostridiales bacterium]|jgi:hypothetical protein|nr:hypothetical protein [Clostridiales bacterium]